jgi:WD40 repeat protein
MLLAIGGWVQPTLEVWSTVRRARVAVVMDNQLAPPTVPPTVGGVKWLAFSPDGKLLATAGLDGDLRIYGVPGYALLVHVSSNASVLAFGPDGRELAVASRFGTINLYSVPASYPQLLQNLVKRATLSGGSQLIDSVQFQPDGTLIAAGLDGDVRFWAMPRGGGNVSLSPDLTLATHGGGIGQVSSSDPLGLLVTAGTSVTRVWDTDPGTVAAGICQTLKAPVQPALWTQYLPGIPYMPVCR